MVARTGAEFAGKSWAALCEALISHYADFRVHDPITQIETFMNSRPPVKNVQQIPMLFLKAREKVDSLVESYLNLPAFSQTPQAQKDELHHSLRRFAFHLIAIPTVPRKVSEKTLICEQDPTLDVPALSKKVIDQVKST